jgi:hypothetical protein
MNEVPPISIKDGLFNYDFSIEEVNLINLALKTLKTQREISLRCITRRREEENTSGKDKRERRKKPNMVLLLEIPPPEPEPAPEPINKLDVVVKAAEEVREKVNKLKPNNKI